MLGSVYLFDTTLKKTIKIYNNKELYDDNNYEFRLNIKRNYLDKYKNRYTLLCSCNSSIELSVDSLGRIYHKNKQDALKHDRLCERHKYYSNNISKGIISDKDRITAILNFSVLPNNKLPEDYLETLKDNSINIQELSKHLNIMACNYKIEDKFDMLTKVFIASKNIYIDGFKDTTIQDFYFNIKDYRKITAKSPKFIYMYLSEVNELENKDYIQIKCQYSKDKYFNFVSHKDLFYKEYLSKYLNNIKNPVVISGFIHKSDNGLEFHQLSLIKVNKDGIY